jgi:hypothetical protein
VNRRKESIAMKRFFGFWVVLGVAACLFSVGAFAAPAAGDAEAKKTAKSAMEKDYMAGDFELALQKLKLADSLCETRGCTPAVRALVTASKAIVHWVGTEDKDTATDELKALVKLDPKYKMTDEYASPELIAQLEAIKQPPPPPPPPAPAKAAAPERDPEQEEFTKKVETRKQQYAREAEEAQRAAAVADERRQAEEKLAEQERKVADAKRTAEEKKQAAIKAAEDRKAEQAKRAEDARKAEEERKAAAIKAAEDKKEAARKAVEDAKKAAEEKKEAARKAAEEKKEADRKAVEDKKEAARKAVEDAKKAAEEKKEAARKAAEEKKEADRKAAEDKKEAARKAVEEKKEAAKRAAEDAAKKAEEARLAKEDARMRQPVPVGKMQETLWREQTIGYPIPVYVKLPAPPTGIEKPRLEVVKVVTEFSSPNVAGPQHLELKPLVGGGYGGLLPCDLSSQEGEVSYFTTALNKYDNPVARGASADKPNKVTIKGAFTGSFPHLPGELPPKACERGAKIAKASCQSDAECPDGVCTKEGCSQKGAATLASGEPPPMANPTPRSGGCAGCALGSRQNHTPAGIAAIVAACGVHILRRRRRGNASAA